MSAETIEWLNAHTLQSRKVWHTVADLQEVYGNIYAGSIPVEDVVSKLFGWKALAGDVQSTASLLTPDGVETFTITDPNRKTMIRPPRALGDDDPGAILGVFKSGYEGHDYEEWLLRNVATILDDDLAIYSAGLLRGGAQAWVQVTVPEAITTPEGVTFRPNLLAVTSFDGSLATTYKRTVGNTVCDNTMGAALREGGEHFKVKHSRYSNNRTMDARAALSMVHTIADDFAANVAELCATTVTDAQWSAFLDDIAPTVDPKSGEAKTGRGLTLAENKRGELSRLYSHDDRVTPWKGTAWGVVQAINTHAHHVQTVRGSGREERNMTMSVTGGWDKLDTETLATLDKVLSAA